MQTTEGCQAPLHLHQQPIGSMRLRSAFSSAQNGTMCTNSVFNAADTEMENT